MMWLGRLFGYDYIAWRNSADQGIARVHKDGNGRVWYWRYRVTGVWDVIHEADQVIWLTCAPSKYLDSPNKSTEKQA